MGPTQRWLAFCRHERQRLIIVDAHVLVCAQRAGQAVITGLQLIVI